MCHTERRDGDKSCTAYRYNISFVRSFVRSFIHFLPTFECDFVLGNNVLCRSSPPSGAAIRLEFLYPHVTVYYALISLDLCVSVFFFFIFLFKIMHGNLYRS